MPDDDRRRAYDRVLGTIEHAPGPVASKRAILTSAASHGSLTADEVRRALQAAVENGDVARTPSGYVRRDEATLLAAIEREIDADDTDAETIGACNAALDDVRSG